MQAKQYEFAALLSRMKYINRWGLMRNDRNETLSEHVVEVAIIAHLLALISRDVLGESDVCPNRVAVAALYHDASEILTGDMPTPVKYNNETLKNAYHELERESAKTLSTMLPQPLQQTLRAQLLGDDLNSRETVLLKAADVLSAWVKCIEEENSGNTEFASAKKQQKEKLARLNCAAADYFVAHFLPCYEQDLDQLTRHEKE